MPDNFLSNKILTDYRCIYLLCTFPQWKTPFVMQTFFCFVLNRWIFLFSFESWKGLRFQSGPKRGARRELVVSIPQLLGEVSFRCREGGGVTLQLSSAEWALCEQTSCAGQQAQSLSSRSFLQTASDGIATWPLRYFKTGKWMNSHFRPWTVNPL